METPQHSRLKSSCLIKARLVFSVIGVIVGVSAGAVFSIHFENYNAGIWGFCSAAAACVALIVTVMYIRGAWDSNPLPLRGLMLSGCFIQLAGVCGFVAYLVLAVSQHQALTAYGQGFYIACVWCFMTWKWGFFLLIYSRTYFYAYKVQQGILGVDAEGSSYAPYKAVD